MESVERPIVSISGVAKERLDARMVEGQSSAGQGEEICIYSLRVKGYAPHSSWAWCSLAEKQVLVHWRGSVGHRNTSPDFMWNISIRKVLA